MNLESYADGEWTWSREVIANGEKVTLLEKGDSLSTLDTLSKNTWYQISYDANNYVVGKALVSNSVVDAYVTSGVAEVTSKIEADNDLIVANLDISDATPSLKGSTLYLNTTDSTGIYVSADAKIALIQKNNNKTTTEFFEGVKNVEGVIDQLNAAADKKYDYFFDAVIEDGAATVIIIEDKNSDGYTLPDASKEPKLTATAKVNKATMTVDVPVVNGFEDTVADKAIAALQDEGYTVTSVKLDSSSGEYKLTATKGAVSGYEFTTNTTVYYKVTFAINAAYKINVQSAYMAQGDEITIVVTGGDWSSVTMTATGSTGTFNVTSQSGSSPCTAKIKATVLAADATVTISYT